MHPLIMHMHHDLPSYIVVSYSAHGSCFTYVRLLQLPVTNQKYMNLTSFKYQGKPRFFFFFLKIFKKKGKPGFS